MKKKISLLLLASLLLTALLSGCGQSPVTVSAPEWETVSGTASVFSYEVPADWTTTEDVTGQGSVIYIPKNADVNTGTSNVNILVQDASGQKAANMKDMKAALESNLKEQLISNGFESVENLKVEELAAPIGDLCVVSYETYLSGMKFTQVQYYPLIDDYIVVITSTNIGDTVEPSAEEVAEYLALTLKKAE
ncbi:MAG: hypothetical protein PHE47_05800 [Oscillospiraceae bacterium]|nr:hypothetical protein [Oscillospiraceae bacterium]